MKEQKLQSTAMLSKNVAYLARIIERRNLLRRRFLSGIFFGLGTALGASVIATIVVILLAQLLQASGAEMLLGNDLYQQLIHAPGAM